MSDIETANQVADELAALKARADLLGVTYHPSIGLEKLREKVNTALATDDTSGVATEAKEPDLVALQQEASKLVRIRVTCMNPAKKEWEGEIFTVGNSLIGTYTKYVPFNVDDGWHVPHVIYQMIVDRECQIFTTVKGLRGNSTRKGKIIREFAVEVLPALTEEELYDLAQRQAMAKSIG